ncbi:MAG: protein translocase subunit SecF [Patescibacteria group bacterium]
MNYKIIQKKGIWLAISIVLFIAAVAALAMWGLKLGIDYTGGSMLEARFEQRPDMATIDNKLGDLNLGSLVAQPAGDNELTLRFQDSTEEKHQAVTSRLKELDKNVEEISFEFVGPSIGAELKKKSINAIFWVLLAVVIYISIAFKKVSRPVASWKYGVSALVAMFHDVVITLGVFAVLGKFYGTEINTSFVAAILTVLGYSIHDTIVVFDRTRENLPKSNEDFEGTVNASVNQTLGRSINTSLTSLLALLAVVLFGGESIRPFALALTIGIFIGTYSSIFVASPLLVVWEKLGRKV